MTETAHTPASRLLHNMSVAPTTAIHHEGTSAGGEALSVTLDLAPADGWRHGKLSCQALAKWLGIVVHGEAAAERELRRLVARHTQTLPLPPACVVSPAQAGGQRELADRLGVVCVLSKSSGHVYLRDKEPNFDRLMPNARLTLIIPDTWRPT